MPVQAGPLTTVKVITDSDLRDNGGRYRLAHVPACPVYRLEGTGRARIAGRPVAVYLVGEDYAGGFYGGAAEPLYVASADMPDPLLGDEALPVYLAPGSPALSDETGGHWWTDTGIPADQFIAVYQPKGAASLAASYVNLANPGTYDLAQTNPLHPVQLVADGWNFTFISDCLNTHFNPGPNTGAFVQLVSCTRDTVTRALFGNFSQSVAVTGRWAITISTVNTAFRNGPLTDGSTISTNLSTGKVNYGMMPGKYYINGVGTAAATLSGLPAELLYPAYVDAYDVNNGVVGSEVIANLMSALVFLHGPISDSQALALAAAMAAL